MLRSPQKLKIAGGPTVVRRDALLIEKRGERFLFIMCYEEKMKKNEENLYFLRESDVKCHRVCSNFAADLRNAHV